MGSTLGPYQVKMNLMVTRLLAFRLAACKGFKPDAKLTARNVTLPLLAHLTVTPLAL